MFPAELERNAFRSSNGEFGWTRFQVPVVVDALVLHQIAILGGELWWVRDGFADWVGLIPQQNGPPGIYVWETKRKPGELWPEFIERCASDTLAAVGRWPILEDLPPDLPGRILYNLTWVSDAEFSELGRESF
jgi:hypothetical protein